jgi:aspartate/methionine/tyrosine aminotransferase
MTTTHESAACERLRPFGTTIFAEMTALAREHDAVNLSQGFPDEDGPPILVEAAGRAMRERDNQYAPLPGTPDLREAISGWWASQGNREADPDSEITVTAGCTEAIAATLLGLLNPGDEVVLFEPFYDSYRAVVALAGAVPRFVRLRREGAGYTFDPDELRGAFTAKTRAVLVNTPHNPTGKVYAAEELGLIASLCVEHDVVAVTDEVYERLVYSAGEGRSHVSLASLDGMAGRTVTMSSLGKTFSMTGWKIGWAIAPPHLTAAVRSAHQFLTFAVARPLQHAAAEAMTSPEALAWVESLRRTLIGRRDLLLGALDRMGFECAVPDAGYFVMARITPLADRLGVRDDVEFVRRMTAEARVAGIPPSAFCADPGLGRDSVRLAFCKNETLLGQGSNGWRAGSRTPGHRDDTVWDGAASVRGCEGDRGPGGRAGAVGGGSC